MEGSRRGTAGVWGDWSPWARIRLQFHFSAPGCNRFRADGVSCRMNKHRLIPEVAPALGRVSPPARARRPGPRLLLLLSAASATTLAGLPACVQASEPIDWTSRLQALGGDLPGDRPIRFGGGTVSRPGRYEYDASLSASGREFFYGVDLGHRAEIRISRWLNGRWSDSEVFLSHETSSYNDPMMSADDRRLYFITDQDSGDGRFDIGFVERSVEGWSEVLVDARLSTPRNEYFWSESAAHQQFFSRDIAEPGAGVNFDIHALRRDASGNGKPLPAEINTPHYEGDPFVSADGRTLVFVSNRPGGAGRGDLYISHRSDDGAWQQAMPLGAGINTAGHEITPYITPDGRWLLFARDGDLFWVSTAVLRASPGNASRQPARLRGSPAQHPALYPSSVGETPCRAELARLPSTGCRKPDAGASLLAIVDSARPIASELAPTGERLVASGRLTAPAR